MSERAWDQTTSGQAPWRQHRCGTHGRQEPLWREVLGARLRRLRKHQGLTLHELAAEAGISPQYLSEIERGRKEPSSEMIAAVSGALGIGLVDLTAEVADELRRDTLSFIGFSPATDFATAPGHPGADVGPAPVVSLSAVA
ncbi:helix-turn-helix transcriptional regulator [Nesterenkonia sp. HG001]|uniref:helix-turn-helix domain-containing protein n=1 Tax=Nesterenkonia sp. HG001 TaxID=2983207 RepID=UPI002ACC356B|nr:helix-turn-helix transcriptional regulator [Nesterenkonia sp. HG001]